MVNPRRFPVVTIALIAFSAAVALFSGLGSSVSALRLLFIADPGSQGFQDIMAGQLWRLVTPIFIHFGPLHLIFNMMWMWDLGRLIESRRGELFYTSFVLLVGIASNIVQYGFAHSPYFGGMSGVVYGLLGYAWMQGHYGSSLGFALNKSTVVMMLGWFVLCWTGLLGPIANWAHTAGLLIGVAWGYATRHRAP
jgi:membrane associated rhomboid family serine protease